MDEGVRPTDGELDGLLLRPKATGGARRNAEHPAPKSYAEAGAPPLNGLPYFSTNFRRRTGSGPE